jgi:hypothetical protein
MAKDGYELTTADTVALALAPPPFHREWKPVRSGSGSRRATHPSPFGVG